MSHGGSLPWWAGRAGLCGFASPLPPDLARGKEVHTGAAKIQFPFPAIDLLPHLAPIETVHIFSVEGSRGGMSSGGNLP